MSALKVAIGSIGSSVIGGIFSDRASSKAADTAQKTSDAQLAYTQEQSDQARGDINRLIPQATDRRNQGYQQQMNFLGQALPVTTNLAQQGNVGAQNVVAGSIPQIQNALMGGQVNYDFMQPQQIDYQSQISQLLAGLPQVYSQEQQSAPPTRQETMQQRSQDFLSQLAGGGVDFGSMVQGPAGSVQGFQEPAPINNDNRAFIMPTMFSNPR